MTNTTPNFGSLFDSYKHPFSSDDWLKPISFYKLMKTVNKTIARGDKLINKIESNKLACHNRVHSIYLFVFQRSIIEKSM
jgi:hypothetical protein